MQGTAFANYAVEDCDFLIAVGSRFDDRVAGKVKDFAPNARIAHMDVDATEIGKVKAADLVLRERREARPAPADRSRPKPGNSI